MLMISDFQISLGLQVLRERSKLLPQTLAVSAGLRPDAVSRIESGELGLSYLTATRLAQALRVNLADFAIAAHALDPAMVMDRYHDAMARSHCLAGAPLTS